MKTCIRNPFLLPVLIAGVGLILAGPVTAQTFTVLHTFNGRDGTAPQTLMLSGNTLYGQTYSGGSSTNLPGGDGTVFKVNTDGTGFVTLFNGAIASAGPGVGLILSGNTLYGAALTGGSSGIGAVFAVNTGGTGLTNLRSFTPLNNNTNSDGAYPMNLILSSNTLYGVAELGGSSGNGTIFSLTLPSPHLAIIHSQDNVVLAWPTNASGFTLQSTTNLGPAAVWTNTTPGPVVIGDQNAVINTTSGTRKFYRLSQ
jgi:uncharacterized repeat protein (TIGR03803 family)